jgi:predicted sugar kinase
MHKYVAVQHSNKEDEMLNTDPKTQLENATDMMFTTTRQSMNMFQSLVEANLNGFEKLVKEQNEMVGRAFDSFNLYGTKK